MTSEVARLVRTLKEMHLTLALAESMTCGLAAHGLAGAKGTSDVFKGGVICYTPEIKESLLGISHRTINKHTCESQKVTDLLCRNLGRFIRADIYAAITGLAAPEEVKQNQNL